MRLAIGLCQQRGCELDQKVMKDAIAVYEAFSNDLRDEGVQDSWDNDIVKAQS